MSTEEQENKENDNLVKELIRKERTA